MDKTFDFLRQIFSLLYQEQDKDWNPARQGWHGKHIPDSALDVQRRLMSSGWSPITDEEITTWLSTDQDRLSINFQEKRKVLYLPALEKDADFVPVLSLKAEFDDDKVKEFRLRVMLVSRDDDGGLRGLGFRLEAPEGKIGEGDEDGRHDFYHAQLISSMEKGKSNLELPIDSPSWLPCNQPSFPLLAESPVSLVICLILTLYGKRYFWSFYQRHSARLYILKEKIKQMDAWINWKGREGH